MILAGGASERFGSCKYIEPINGIPLILWTLKPYLGLYFDYNLSITIVAGPFYEAIFELLNNKIEPFYGKRIKIKKDDEKESTYDLDEEDKYNDKINENNKNIVNIDDSFENELYITMIKNKNYQKGMFSSFKKGINCALSFYGNKNKFKKEESKIILSLGDMPFISINTILNLVKNLNSCFNDFAVPYTINYNEKEKTIKTKKGHPIVIKTNFALKISNLDDNITLRDALKKGKCKLIKTDDIGITIDIDTKDDIIKALNLINLGVNNGKE